MNNSADEISQAEGRRIIAEERRGRTYQGHAIASANDERGGRFALSGKATSVTGSRPASEYPRQPEHSPWHRDPLPPEPLIDGRGEGNVLGYEIDRPDGAPPGVESSSSSAAASADGAEEN